MQFNRARYYSPSDGRWVSEDPIGFMSEDLNYYRYAENAPSTRTDTSGLRADPEPPPDPAAKMPKPWFRVVPDSAYNRDTEVTVTDLGDNGKRVNVKVINGTPDGSGNSSETSGSLGTMTAGFKGGKPGAAYKVTYSCTARLYRSYCQILCFEELRRRPAMRRLRTSFLGEERPIAHGH